MCSTHILSATTTDCKNAGGPGYALLQTTAGIMLTLAMVRFKG